MTELKITQADIDRAEDFRGLEISEGWTIASLRAAFARHRIAAEEGKAELVAALEFLANAARLTAGFASPMALKQADAALARVRGEG